MFFGVFRKIIIFWGMKILWIFFWGHHKIGLYFGVIFMHFRVLVQNGDIFLGCQNFKKIFGVLEISDKFFGVKGRCWVRAYICRKIESTPSGPPPPVYVTDQGTKIPLVRL